MINDMARSIIFLTTPTSGTGSMFRTLRAIAGDKYQRVGWLEALFDAGRIQDAVHEVPPTQDSLILHRAPHFFNPTMRLLDYRFILNARDPRDMVCNQYHWQFVHDVQNETPEQTIARRDRVSREGIDAFALRFDNSPYLKGFFNAARRIAPPDRIFVGYAMYCLHFDDVVARMAEFLEVQPRSWTRKQRARIERERVENLETNPAWIGQHWAGTDTAPGRHRRELQPETIRILTERYRWFLDFLQRMDDPRVAATYD
jgi:hypothetical protein